jgi:hypothetical protein
LMQLHVLPLCIIRNANIILFSYKKNIKYSFIA